MTRYTNFKKENAVADVMLIDLYNAMYKTAFGMTESEYKTYKNIPQNTELQDHMNDLELKFNNFLELCFGMISESQNPKGWEELKLCAIQAGEFMRDVIKSFEERFFIKVCDKRNNMDDYFKRNSGEALKAVLEMDKLELEALVDAIKEKKKGKK